MSDFRLLQLNNYIKPDILEVKSKNWVLNGDGQKFFKYIIDRYNGSVTNSSIIDSYSALIYSGGLAVVNGTEGQQNYLNNIISEKELRKVCSDFELFGEASLQVVKSKGGLINGIGTMFRKRGR